ncbi:IQ calmodulin-binding motif family protein, putative [Ichthyophthirius multifiliis]|uniref:IQ calmodulin-binding motif family protein, putative n=1 Tax=Ichthyophthirius multifiliis TaxID=5932 RepID=G0QZ66_ICHMU|nr:IQ calmodulin-binding motif family protein, putative [Ichthyophthirius multifiliis]EGR29489.1 IQ calmodulin-binding motif family protein, putative [Ichthyophthirius multifiliis]|eukprot:XP_004030725.1 IQ calmodulin-binding motif family protein, putative [Ichthyophthirius multifiliis]
MEYNDRQENEYFNQCREERLSRMLLTDIYENDYKWQLYEDEKTEFVMELSDYIFEDLVEEMIEQMQKGKKIY